MSFKEIIGQNQIIHQLKYSIEQKRIAHAQLFHGDIGSGPLPMAIAYAQAILCSIYPKNSEAYYNCAKRVKEGNHPDLHYIFPVNRKAGMNKPPISNDFIKEWKEFITKNSYGSLYEWLQFIGIGNKQGHIGVLEAKEITKALSFKSFEGGYKVLILWMPELMNTACANALLKLVEEPPKNSILLFVSQDANQVLGTIRSRCQLLHFPPLTETILSKALEGRLNLNLNEATLISKQARGSFTKALELSNISKEQSVFEILFIQWVRTAFRARGNKSVLLNLIDWSDTIAASGRESQKQFLQFCTEMFRQAFLISYKTPELVYYQTQDKNFKLENFAQFIHHNNIYDIFETLEKAIYHIERNGNPKTIFTDLSIQLTRFLHARK